MRLLDEAMASGGTHLLVPREEADWLAANPLVADYLTAHHDLADANAKTGLVFTLRPPEPVAFTVEISGWETVAGEGIALQASRTLTAPRVTLRPTAPVRGSLTGTIGFFARGLNTVRLRFVQTTTSRWLPGERPEVVLSLARPGYLIHNLPFVEATFKPDGSVRLAFDLQYDADHVLDRIRLDLVEEDNWRVHPDFPGGKSFKLPAEAPAGARLELRELALGPTSDRP